MAATLCDQSVIAEKSNDQVSQRVSKNKHSVITDFTLQDRMSKQK